MEKIYLPYSILSLLVREINWLETRKLGWAYTDTIDKYVAPYSLGKLIDWKPDQLSLTLVLICFDTISLLVREINWLETQLRYQ